MIIKYQSKYWFVDIIPHKLQLVSVLTEVMAYLKFQLMETCVILFQMETHWDAIMF